MRLLLPRIVKSDFVQDVYWTKKFLKKSIIWQTIVFVELIVILANSKQSKIEKVAKLLRKKCFGVNVICISVIFKRNKTIVENAHNFLVIC